MSETAPIGCDPAVLSAYRDGALSDEERQRVHSHLGECEACRHTFDSYAAVGASLRIPVTLPRRYALRTDLHARLDRRMRYPWARGAAPAVAMVASVALAGTVVLAGKGVLAPPVGQESVLSEAVTDRQAERGFAGAIPAERAASRDGSAPRACAQPVPSVSTAFSRRPELLQALGCATDAPRVVGLVSQSFERGDLLRRSDTRELYVIGQDGRWRRYADPGPSVQPVSLNMGGERLELSPWFGRAWVERADLRGLLGQVVSAWRQHQGLVQVYENGAVLWDGRGMVYALTANGQSLQLADRSAAPREGQTGPSPLPTIESHFPTQLAAL